MSIFLEKTAEYLVSTYGLSLSDCCIVLPNKRAGLFLKQHLSKIIKKPIWLPPIVGAEDLIEELSSTQIIDNLTQLFELYDVYAKTIDNPENFEEFSKWGQILLHDFNEIDRYLIPTDDFFKTINDVRAIEVWNLGERELSEIQKNYLAFWKQMGVLYQAFYNHLGLHKKSYQGQAFRIVAEQLLSNPKEYIEKNIKWEKVIYIGFNALTHAEETIVSELKKFDKADIIWDADKYYLEDELQESGMFLRGFKQKTIFHPFNWVTDKFKTEKKHINIIGIPQNIGQAKYLPSILNKIQSEVNYQDTAVVLAEESLLVPVLDSIPSEIKNINVTMGYPISNTPLSNFFQIYFNTLLNANRFGKSKQLIYHYKDLTKLFQLPFSHVVFGSENCKKITEHIVEHNWVFITKDKLSYINQILPFPLFDSYSLNQTLSSCLMFIETGKKYYAETIEHLSENRLELEYLFHFSKLFSQIKLLSEKYQVIDGVKTFVTIYRQLLSSLNIELYGEPLKGLQVMGMLETRNIDFKNVVLLSTNEGILPAGKTFNSFIPFDIKRAYKLPTHIEKDAVYAYHFYRLIQNAENIYILYNTETNEFGSGEKSRFVTQLENELSGFSNIHIDNKIVTYPVFNNVDIHHQVFKTAEVIDKVFEFFERGVSPSAINTFLNCPLDFYYKYVLRLQEVDEVEENVEANTFGKVIHSVLEELYKPFEENKLVISGKDIEKMMSQVDALTKKAFYEERFTEKELNSGKNLITFNMAKDYVCSFLTNELEFLKVEKPDLHIKCLEKEYFHKLDLNGQSILLKGKADRVDTYANKVRILDYKTGSAETKDLSLDVMEKITDKQKAFQVLFYAYLFFQENNIEHIELNSGIIALKKKRDIYLPFNTKKSEKITAEILMEFEIILKKLLSEITDTSVPFKHNKESKYCLYCN